MKYKCTDCGQEYDIKPEFCDCGNNIFEEINEINDEIETLFSSSQPEIPSRPIKRNNIDILSLLIFILCIVLSILSWIFIGRDAKIQDETLTNNPVQTNVNAIPSIDSLWNEKTPSINEPVATQPISEPVAVKVVEKQVPQKVLSQKVTQKTNTPQKNTQATVAQTSKTTAISQPQKQSTSIVQQAKPTMTEQQKQEIIQKLSTRKTVTPKAEPQKVEQQKNEPQKVVEQPKQEQIKQEVKQEVKVPDTAQLKRELEAYKIALRNKLGKSINFSAVIGDGKCAVSFKIDQTGNLINRKFSVQSQNNSLNDAVYAAMMQNPTFKEPPAGYKNETLTLTVTMYGGNFEIKLK